MTETPVTDDCLQLKCSKEDTVGREKVISFALNTNNIGSGVIRQKINTDHENCIEG